MPAYRDFEPTRRFKQTLAISPDDTKVAYVDDALGQFNLVVQPVHGGEPVRLTSYVDAAVTWMAWHPDGESLVFLADAKGTERAQIHRVDLAGGEPQLLTDSPVAQFEGPLGYPFSLEGGNLLLACSGNDRVPDEQDVLTLNMATGEVARLYADGGRMYAGHWSPDGAWLSVADWREGNSDHVVYLVPAKGGRATRLTRPDVIATYFLGPWLRDGTGFLVLSDAGRDFTGLGVLDASTGDLSWLDTPEWDVEDAALSRDGRVLLWSVNVDGASQLRARDLTTNSNLPVPVLSAGREVAIRISSDGRFAVMLFSKPTRPWNVAVIDLTTGSMRWLTDASPRDADTATFVEPTMVRYPARDGRAIPAYVYRPAGSGPTGVLLSIHGGPPAQERPVYSNDGFFQYLVSHGIAVFAPNVRGSTGYGMAYQKLSYRDWGGGDLDDLAAAVDYLRAQDWVDAKRIALMGASYGGFGVLSCLARLPEVDWAAAVDWFGPSNLVTLAQASPPTWRTKVAAMIGDPVEDAEFLMSRSPVIYAHRIHAPLFVIQGANDNRVPRRESDQIVQRLRERGVEVRYDVYPDEGHGFAKRANQSQARSDAGEFLMAHLAG